MTRGVSMIRIGGLRLERLHVLAGIEIPKHGSGKPVFLPVLPRAGVHPQDFRIGRNLFEAHFAGFQSGGSQDECPRPAAP